MLMGTATSSYLSDPVSKRRQGTITENALLNVVSPYVRNKTHDALGELNGLLRGYTDYQKVCLLYRLVADNTVYDRSFKASSYSYLAVLKRGVGVCAGISAFFFLLCRACIHNGTAYQVVGDVDIHGEMQQPHAWNAIELDTPNGRGSYFLDVTWDLGKEPGAWNWFLRGTDIPGRTWDSSILPRISDRSCDAAIFTDGEKSRELAHWFSQLGSRFDSSIYKLL